MIAKSANPYYKNWNQLNNKPYKQAPNNALIASALLPLIRARCAQIVQTPEDRRITVLAKGRCHGIKVSIPTGGQTQPTPTAGAALE